MKIKWLYDLTSDCSYLCLVWGWKNRNDRPNAPQWWTGGYSHVLRLIPLTGFAYRMAGLGK